ncbi:KAT8 regulatory NSL complex subunit 1-like protein isoform X2 [Dunckerocampus dactyliophorus]|uniref:KAT8 regulatory NSL complex subunit 1-like protein isoform X2 n=1 Tax=Dunckerocampus dactyliophorus TaxID=161453 RepID=UPI0024063CFB|nr:KAT8 regulatory NSL complex subunit 1-like protein isoform X2 [Dunckerocampus dactyliophorus]
MRSTEGGCLKKMCLDFSSVPPLDIPANPRKVHASPLCSQVPSGLSLQCSNEVLKNAHQVSAILPGVEDISDYNSREASKCGPDGVDVHRSSPSSQVQADLSSLPLASEQNIWQTVLEEAVKETESRSAGLNIRVRRLQRRVQNLLGEIASLHCSQQLEELSRLGQHGGVPPQTHVQPHVPRAALPFTDLSNFRDSNQALLRHLEQDYDSEATASSSDEEEDEVRLARECKTPVIGSSCEHKWLKERAEIGSRWCWLQLRLADLEGKIVQLGDLHRNIRSSKGGVVLAESQPPTDRQIQQTLLKDMAGLSCTDADSEPCSPHRLLYNIERQSAQLSQIVNSLMVPLRFPTPSKQQMWKGGRDASSGHREDVFIPWGSNRRLKRCRTDVSCVCARTRPLVTHRKPKLFLFNSYNNFWKFAFSLSPLSSRSSLTSSSIRTQSELTASYETPQRTVGREEWSQKPLSINVQPCSPSHSNRCRLTLHNSYRHGMCLASIKLLDSTRGQCRRRNRSKRKRRHALIDGMSEVYLLSAEEMLEDIQEKSCMQASRGFTCQHKRGRDYNMNRLVAMPVAVVEKRLSEHILTPSWRFVDAHCQVEESVRDAEERQVEVVTNEVFAQRHLALELKEKLYSTSWGRTLCCRRSTRSGSRLRGSGSGMFTSGEESSVVWSSSQLDADKLPDTEQGMTHWEPRKFPLDEEQEECLRDDTMEVQRPLVGQL